MRRGLHVLATSPAWHVARVRRVAGLGVTLVALATSATALAQDPPPPTGTPGGTPPVTGTPPAPVQPTPPPAAPAPAPEPAPAVPAPAPAATPPPTAPPPAAAQPRLACVVPKVTGKTVGATTKALTHAHCRLGQVKRTTTGKKSYLGRVISQSPKPGVTLPAGARIRITVRRSSRNRAHARNLTGFSYGSARCTTNFGGASGTSMGISNPSAIGDDGDWVRYYNGVFVYQGGQWVVDDRQWVGPFWTNTNYPGWYWYGGSWSNNYLSGSSTHQIAPGQYATGVQWVNDYSTGWTGYVYVNTSQVVGLDETKGFCRGY